MDPTHQRPHTVGSDIPFFAALIGLGSIYLVLVLAMVLADATFTQWSELWTALQSREIVYAIKLSLITATLAALLSLWVATPVGYLLSRFRFPGRTLLDAVLDIPIVLPPVVIGLSLLILFQSPLLRTAEDFMAAQWNFGFTYRVGGVVLAQFIVACAFAVRVMRATFDQIDVRREQVALTLGCTRGQAFWMVVLPDARRGLIVAFTLAWSRALGEFGPILVFAGATRMHTEVMPTTIFLELSVGNIEAAVAVSLVMVFCAILVLVLVRVLGQGELHAGRWGSRA